MMAYCLNPRGWGREEDENHGKEKRERRSRGRSSCELHGFIWISLPFLSSFPPNLFPFFINNNGCAGKNIYIARKPNRHPEISGSSPNRRAPPNAPVAGGQGRSLGCTRSSDDFAPTFLAVSFPLTRNALPAISVLSYRVSSEHHW